MSIILDIEKKVGNFHLNFAYSGEKAVIGILGASGCGKSMTLKSIAGIETPDRGQIELEGRTLFNSKKRINLKPQDRSVGYLFQNYALFPTMTVEQNIMAGLKGDKQEKRRIAGEMMERFGLEKLAGQLPSELSGGQQQRTALARILVTEPQTLLLDEPFSALDGSMKERLRLEMGELLHSYDGVSFLVTHDRDEAYQLCDQLLLMDQGKLIEAGSKEKLFEAPETVTGARITSCKNISRIRKTGLYSVRALDWGNLEFKTEKPVTKEITHIGIRAHDFYPLNEWEYSMEKRRGINTAFPVRNPMVTELPFEWCVTFEEGLMWRCPKEIRQHQAENSIPYGLGVRPSAVMLLREH
ncbi:MAG: ATP-binding cassette domain-containing protein [Lachnospiraceae bacterium]|nr:ATP-binding cassette domain-containing protein [Lachnospiraceae bacterium]